MTGQFALGLAILAPVLVVLGLFLGLGDGESADLTAGYLLAGGVSFALAVALAVIAVIRGEDDRDGEDGRGESVAAWIAVGVLGTLVLLLVLWLLVSGVV